MKKTAIVIPCFNEAERLPPEVFIAALKDEAGLNFIFVDDGSTDSTQDVLRGIEKACPAQSRVLALAKNSGKAEAVRLGVTAALKEDFVNIGYLDADLAIPIETIKRFCAILDETDKTVVLGSRVKLLGRHIERSVLRHILGRFFATLASNILHLAIYDTQCGAKVFKRTESLERAFSMPFNVRWTFDVEVLARLGIVEMARGNAGYERTWMEYPLETCLDIKGSKVSYMDIFRSAAEMFKIFALTHIPVIKDRYRKRLTAGA